MKRFYLYGVAVVVLFGIGTYSEHRLFSARMQRTASVIAPDTAVMKPAPIKKDWVLEGHPVTEAATIARTDDGSTKVLVWQTTAGRFTWTYDFDEVVQLVDGEVFLSDEKNVERRAGAGDVIFFPAGAKVTWRVPHHVRKIATMKNALPTPVSSMMRWARIAKAQIRPTQALAD